MSGRASLIFDAGALAGEEAAPGREALLRLGGQLEVLLLTGGGAPRAEAALAALEAAGVRAREVSWAELAADPAIDPALSFLLTAAPEAHGSAPSLGLRVLPLHAPGTGAPAAATLDLSRAIERAATIHAARILRAGGLVAFPTETVYGLGADAEDEAAVGRIFAVKGRPADHPLIVHLAGAEQLDAWAIEVPEVAYELAAASWPGPLTLILKKGPRAPAVVTGGQATIGLRVPAHPLALSMIREQGGGVAAPSANRFGRVSPTSAAHVREDLGGDVDFILDGGPAEVGVESTIVDLSSGMVSILRPGGAPAELIEAIARAPVPVRRAPPRPGEVRAPGLLRSHYAPRARVVLGDAAELEAALAVALQAGEPPAVIAGASWPALGSETARVLEARGIPCFRAASDAALARGLYGFLRAADASGATVILVERPVARGLGLALLDRLEKAAAPRG